MVFSVRSVLLCLKFVVRCFYSLVHCASSNEFQWHFDFGHVTHDFDAQCTGRVCSKKWPQRVYGEHLRKVFFCVWIIKQLITMHILHFGCYCGRKENNNENIIREGLTLVSHLPVARAQTRVHFLRFIDIDWNSPYIFFLSCKTNRRSFQEHYHRNHKPYADTTAREKK